jgi:hypothetical protein
MTFMNKHIPETLYDNYIRQDVTPKDLKSSHWEDFHHNVVVRKRNGYDFDLQGYGFGDLQATSLPAKISAWMTIHSYLLTLKDREDIRRTAGIAKGIAKKMGCAFTYDCFRQVCALVLLRKYLSVDKEWKVINIGDGYGYLSCLLKTFYPNAKIFLVDLGKTLLFQSVYCQKVFPHAQHVLVTPDATGDGQEADFIYCPAEHIGLTQQKFNLAVNVASMQEMNPATVALYFDFLRQRLESDNLFYCCNRLEKVMPGGEISSLMQYPWSPQDQHLIDELCPWYKYMIHHRMSARGPQWGALRIPFINYFDGDIWHRLTKLAVR